MLTRRTFIQTAAAAAIVPALPAVAAPSEKYPLFVGITHRGSRNVYRSYTIRGVTVREGLLVWTTDAGILPTRGICTVADAVLDLAELMGGLDLQRICVCGYTGIQVIHQMEEAGLPVSIACRTISPITEAATKVQIHQYRHAGWPVFSAAFGHGGRPAFPVRTSEDDRQIHDIVAVNFALQGMLDERPDMLAAAGIPGITPELRWV